MYAIKCLRVIIVLNGLWIHTAGCYYYCDDEVGICLYTNRTTVTSWREAHEQCRTNGSILLEIYNENYKNVVTKAITNFILEGWYLLLGLEYTYGQFRWSSGQNLTLSITGMDAFNGNCNAFIVLKNSKLFVFPACDNTHPNHTFLCLKDNNEPHTNEHSTSSTASFDLTIDNNIASQGLESTISFFTIPQFAKKISIPQVNNNEQQQQNGKIRIGVGVGVALSVFSIVLIILTVCFVKKRLMKQNKSEKTVENSEGPSLPPTNSPNGTSLIYADLDFKEKTTESYKPNISLENPTFTYNNDEHPSFYPYNEMRDT